MLAKVPATRLRLINKIIDAAKVLDVRPSARHRFNTFIRLFYRNVATDELQAYSLISLSQIAHTTYVFGQHRRHNDTLVSVSNADHIICQTGAARTVVRIVCLDMPFLVTSANMAITAAGYRTHRLVHPVITANRNHAGVLTDFGNGNSAAHTRESWQLVEIDYEPLATKRAALERELRRALTDVKYAVTDWAAMREQALTLAQSVLSEKAVGTTSARQEISALLQWMAADNFTFLGTRCYQLIRGTNHDSLRGVDASGLGILRRKPGSSPQKTTLLAGPVRTQARSRSPLILTKANRRSTVHRAVPLDYIGIKLFDRNGCVIGEQRFLGLWADTAYSQRPTEIPVLRRKVAEIVSAFGLDPYSHDGKVVTHVIDTFPRDELIQASLRDLIPTIRGIGNLYERAKVRLFLRRDVFHRFVSAILYIPRDRYSTDVRGAIETVFRSLFRAQRIDSTVELSDSALARVHLIIYTLIGNKSVSPALLEKAIEQLLLTWDDKLRALITRRGSAQTLDISLLGAFPPSYQAETPPQIALDDIETCKILENCGDPFQLRVRASPDGDSHVLRLNLYQQRAPRAVSDVLQTFENLGLRLLNERPYEIKTSGKTYWIQDFELQLTANCRFDIRADAPRLTTAISAMWTGQADNDGFNKLILSAGLGWRQVALLRTYARWFLQIGTAFSQRYMEQALTDHPTISGAIFAFFSAKFDVRLRATTRKAMVLRLQQRIMRLIKTVDRLDDDRILRLFYTAVGATVRTTYFKTDLAEKAPQCIAIKIASHQIPEVPEPRPLFEIWAHSPLFEAVHLRSGLVARGGIRWSERLEDFRAEILGLMKAQNVKNAVIIPVGAKGGFVCRAAAAKAQPPISGLACYQLFMRALLDLTDNISEGIVKPPLEVVRYDSDDPYLVVAADKGTSTFSDAANIIAASYGYWLGDAFASGGSAGYDHKKMAITARGAWECIKRHFREAGIAYEASEFTVAGIGDMSGDVFGNGLLLSRHAKLVAAFNHQHIFIDPTPNTRQSYRERQRLFRLPRSGWNDYKPQVLSAGGGVWARNEKTLRLSPQAQNLLGLSSQLISPNEVIRAILKLNVDLLWNGGIGTYVKASSETNAMIADRANDAVRVDGKELRCRVVGEGGNLGFSQLARVEYALSGGRINTDSIDNAGGVSCSDLEVNIKVLLALAKKGSRLTKGVRDRLLFSMTNPVTALVLRNNYLQSQAISTLELYSLAHAKEHLHVISYLHSVGDLDPELEFLPESKSLLTRIEDGRGLTRPELAILLSYSKIWLNRQIVKSELPEDKYLARELIRYFPERVSKPYLRLLPRHPLAREIISTVTTNSIVNRMGPAFVIRAMEETGSSISAITHAYAIARESTHMRALWSDIEGLDGLVSPTIQYTMHASTADALKQATYWLLNDKRSSLDIETRVATLAPRLQEAMAGLLHLAKDGMAHSLKAMQRRYEDAHTPPGLAARVTALALIQAALSVSDLSQQHHRPIPFTCHIYLRVSDTLGLYDLNTVIDTLPAETSWQAIARRSLRDRLYKAHSQIARAALRQPMRQSSERTVTRWLAKRSVTVTKLGRVIKDATASVGDFAILMVAISALEELASS